MHWLNWAQNCGMAGFGGFMMILFWGVIIAGVVLLVRMLARSSGPGPDGETPVDVLKKRYARGDITKGEYEEMLKDLQSH